MPCGKRRENFGTRGEDARERGGGQRVGRGETGGMTAAGEGKRKTEKERCVSACESEGRRVE